MINPENRNYITSIECIGSIGKTVPPMLLVSGVNILHKWCHHNDLDGDIMIGITETGYVNDNTAFEWLQHFINHIQNKRCDAWLLVIIDGYGSHITLPFYNLANKNKIVLFRLRPHSTHLTQPLNIGVF